MVADVEMQVTSSDFGVGRTHWSRATYPMDVLKAQTA